MQVMEISRKNIGILLSLRPYCGNIILTPYLPIPIKTTTPTHTHTHLSNLQPLNLTPHLLILKHLLPLTANLIQLTIDILKVDDGVGVYFASGGGLAGDLLVLRDLLDGAVRGDRGFAGGVAGWELRGWEVGG
jgi:hypothetical protein